MARNIELKVKVDSVEALLPRARALADGEPTLLLQDDTFFRVPQGRLKLREFGDGSAELIQYDRADGEQARRSDYVRVAVSDALPMREALTRALGLHGRVRKRRWLLLHGQTRMHLDRVEGLGDFLELEVVMTPAQADAEGTRTALSVLQALGLAAAERVPVAYRDLLAEPQGAT